jgi:hypothetical protein
MSKKYLSWKWAPANENKIHVRSSMKDKYKVMGNEILDLVLTDGMVIHETKRESNSLKMNHREKIGNITQNPFLKNNYLQDIQNQEEFMTPKNSNQQLENIR